MQANSQPSGQLQNLHGKGTTPGDGISNTLGQNFYHPSLPSHAASPSYPGQGATGNYLTHFTCTIQPTTSDQILSTKDSMPAQENPVTSEYILPTGKPDSQVILWNVPSNCQIFLPVNNLNLQGGPNNNGPNVSHCAFNSNNNLYMQQQNTSLAAGPNNSQHVKAKTMDAKSLNKPRHVNTINLLRRQRYANRPVLPKACFAKTTTEKPYDLKSSPPTENAPHGHSSLFGYNYQALIPENSTNANLQTPSTFVQNIGAQRAVAVVTPLSPIGIESVNASDKSDNMKMNARTVQEIVRHQPNIPHALENNANQNNQNREPNNPINKHQRPKLTEPRLNYGFDNVGAKSPVSTDESPVSISSPTYKSVASEQKKSVPTQMENELSEKINDRTFTDKDTVEMETIPVIEWPLDRLDTLITVIQQIENRLPMNDQKTNAGRDIIKLYWNGDFRKFYDAVQSGLYQNIMEEVFVYCGMRESVILRQPKSDARNKVNKDFHVLKHNEEPPKMMYKSSWLNLNENVNDIDKDCGYSLVYKSFQNDPDHEAQIPACKAQSNLQEATEKPSVPGCKRLPTEVENKSPAEEPTSNSESLNENLSILFNGHSPPVTNTNFSKCDCVGTKQTNSQPNITNSLEDITLAKDLEVQTLIFGSDDQFCNDGPKSTEPCESSEMMESNLIATSPDKDETSLNTSLVLDTTSMKEQTSGQSAGNKPSLAEHDGLTDITNKVQIEEQTSLEKNMYNKSLGENSPPVTDNCLLKLNVVKEQTSCQANGINPLNAMTNLVRTLKERDYLLRRHQSGLKGKPKPSTATLRLNSSFCNGVEAKSPVLTSESSSQSDSTSPLTLSPVVEKQQPFVMLTRIQNESSDFDNRVRCEINPKPSQELSVQMDEGEMGALASIRINVLPPEVAERYFAGQLTEDNDMAATPEVMHKTSLMHTPQEHDLTLTKEQMERLEEADGNLQKGYVVVEQNNCQSNTIHPLKAMTHLVMGVGQKRRTGNCDLLKYKHQPSTATSRLVDSFCNGAKSPTLTGSISQTDYASPPKLHPVTADPSQIQLNKEMPEIDCMLTEERMRCETDPKPSQELPVQINEEEIVKMDATASIRINVLPQEVAKLCFAGQLMDDQDITAPPEMMQKTSLLQTPQDTIPTKEQIHMWRLDEAIGNYSLKGNLVPEQTNCQSNIVHPLKAMTHLVMSFGEQKRTVKSEILKNRHQSANATSFCNQAKCSVLTTASTCQIDYRSPPKLHPVIAEPSPMQNEEMHEIDYMLTDESMRYETDSKPRQELTLNTNKQGTDKMDASDYIKINVLPHNMAEGWFASEMEVKDSQKDVAVHITTEDQITFQVLEHMSEKECLEDVKPKEGTCQSSGDEKLESYCCLAKWFQTLEYGDGASCMCQKKAELREETKIEVHGTNLALQTEKENPNELVELENSALEGTDDSETTEDEVPSRIVHMGDMILVDMSSSEEVCKMEAKILEQTRPDSDSECPTNVKNDVKQDTPTSDLTRKANTISLALYGSSSGRKEATQTKRFKGKDSCEEPPETLQVTIHSHQKNKGKRKSKHKGVELQDDNLDSKLSKNALSSTSIKKLLGPSANAKRSVHLGEGKKRKRLLKYSVKQMSMNKYVFRGKAVASKLLHSSENVTKSKYELRNPALMPLDEGPSLEFKVLPESFNFEDGAVLGCTQADMSQSTQNGMSGPQDKVKRMKISRSPTEGVWSFSPLKKKHTQPIQVTDASGSCSLFQEYKKRYCKKLNSSES